MNSCRKRLLLVQKSDVEQWMDEEGEKYSLNGNRILIFAFQKCFVQILESFFVE